MTNDCLHSELTRLSATLWECAERDCMFAIRLPQPATSTDREVPGSQAEPKGELEAKLRELADAQTELDPDARRVLYSRMRELYVREPKAESIAAAPYDGHCPICRQEICEEAIAEHLDERHPLNREAKP